MSNIVNIKTDFHAHLLPDVDCSGNPEISAKLLKGIKASGVENIVLTPHFYPQHNSDVEDFLIRRDKNIQNLKEEMDKNGLSGINLIPGAEVLLCPGIEHMKGLEKLCFQGANTILIEMPDLPWSDMLFESLKNIKEQLNLDIVIAHADRYGKYNAIYLINSGFKVQINTESVLSLFMRRIVLDWAKKGYVYALGSDKHVHADKASLVYNDFPKADKLLSKYSSIINERSLSLIKAQKEPIG